MTKPLRVLLVDDDEDEVWLVDDELRQAGLQAELRRVDTNAAMVDALETSVWDLLLVDWTMPAFSAADAFRLYQKFELRCPFIVISGVVEEGVAVQLMKLGAHDFIPKGHRERLLPAIRRELFVAAGHIQQRETEERFDTLLSASADMAFLMGVDGILLAVNEVLAAALGKQRRDLTSSSVWDIFSEPAAAKARAVLESVVQSKRPRQGDSHHAGKIYFHSVYPILDDMGHVGQLVVFVTDITSRRRTEDALERSLHRYQSILESTMDGYWLVDTRGKLQDVDDTYCRMSGYSKEELLTMTISDLEEAESGDEVTDHIEQVIVNGEDRFESRHRRKDGSVYDVEVSTRYRSHGGGFFVSFLRDISEQKKQEVERARLERELQQTYKMEALGQLTGGIAHDFNNILGIILGYTEASLAQCDRDGHNRLSGYLNRVMTAGLRAKGLVARMLTFSRGENRGDTLLHLPPLIRENLNMLRATLPASIEVTTEIDDVSAVIMDPGQANQLLMNLCINARDAMNGKGNIHVRLREVTGMEAECSACHKRVEGDWIELSVTDSGVGIQDDVVGRIFDPFFTTKDVGKGTGLGLAVVAGIMRSHAGHIIVSTEPGKGTNFRLIFPRLENNEAGNEDSQPTSVNVQQGHGERILIVDDEPDLAEFIGDVLNSYHYSATVLTSSETALERFRRDPEEFALVIADQTMPGLTGIELVTAMRDFRPDLPMILTSGFNEDLDQVIAAELGVRYLEKPFQVNRLVAELNDLLGAADITR